MLSFLFMWLVVLMESISSSSQERMMREVNGMVNHPRYLLNISLMRKRAPNANSHNITMTPGINQFLSWPMILCYELWTRIPDFFRSSWKALHDPWKWESAVALSEEENQLTSGFDEPQYIRVFNGRRKDETFRSRTDRIRSNSTSYEIGLLCFDL